MDKLLENGATVLFIGDSVTDCGRNRADLYDLGKGYPKFVAQALRELYPEKQFTFINKGVSGDRTRDLLARYDADFAPHKADLISILIGINDVWRRYDQNDPTSARAFVDNYQALLEQLKRDFPEAKILMIEPFLLHQDDSKDAWNEDFEPKLQAVHDLAADHASYFLPAHGVFDILVRNGYPSTRFSADDVHPTEEGHKIIATCWLDLLDVKADKLLMPEDLQHFGF
ncbi:MAG: SGNH/GDSL hydrolase family protein [Clostridia bacterium]|nr:SGNH/GDSL hydrolase family protein [Clostridia bacterium]